MGLTLTYVRPQDAFTDPEVWSKFFIAVERLEDKTEVRSVADMGNGYIILNCRNAEMLMFYRDAKAFKLVNQRNLRRDDELLMVHAKPTTTTGIDAYTAAALILRHLVPGTYVSNDAVQRQDLERDRRIGDLMAYALAWPATPEKGEIVRIDAEDAPGGLMLSDDPENPESIYLHPVGGGFGMNLKPEVGIIRHVLSGVSDYELGSVEIDEFGPFRAWYDDAERWNGWHRPLFDKATAIKILDLSDLDYSFDEVGQFFTVMNDNEEDGIYVCQGVAKPALETELLYPLMAGDWCWTIRRVRTKAKA